MRLHSSVCVSFTRQSESLGPVHPAAHCMWQQSLARGPLHRWQPDAHLVLVTLNKYEKVKIFSCTSLIYLVSLSYSAHDVNSQVSQSRAVSPQHLFSHTLEQFGPVPEETTKKGFNTFNNNSYILMFVYTVYFSHLTLRGPRLQSVQLGINVLLVQSVPPIDFLGVWEAQLGVPPNIHPTQEDLCRGDT